MVDHKAVLDAVDVQSLLGYFCRYERYVPCAQAASQHGDNPSVFALSSYPVFIGFHADGREADLDAQFISLEQQVFHYVAARTAVGAYQYAQ